MAPSNPHILELVETPDQKRLTALEERSTAHDRHDSTDHNRMGALEAREDTRDRHGMSDHNRIGVVEKRVDEHDRQLDELMPTVLRIDRRVERMDRLLGHPGPDPKHPLDGADGVVGDLGMVALAVAHDSAPPAPVQSYPPPRGEWGDETGRHLLDPDKIVRRVHHAERGAQRWKTGTVGLGTAVIVFEVARETGLLASIFRALAHALGG